MAAEITTVDVSSHNVIHINEEHGRLCSHLVVSVSKTESAYNEYKIELVAKADKDPPMFYPRSLCVLICLQQYIIDSLLNTVVLQVH